MNKENLYKDLTKITQASNIYVDEPMSKHTSFKIGGCADIFIKVQTIDNLKSILEYANKNTLPITIIGNGSNLLVKDNGIRGITIQIALKDMQIQENRGEIIVDVQSGVKLGELSGILQKKSISGFEFASGIPGTIGGAIRMNAGAYGKEFKDIVKTVTYMNDKFEILKIQNEEAQFSYRNSRFSKTNDVIVSAELSLVNGDSKQIQNQINEYKKARTEKQPIDKPSAGSTFKRGDDFITAKLIDDAGLKGYKIGGAEVSTKHAGFIVNNGNATAKDVLELTQYIKDTIYKKFNKNIELEIQVVGE